MLANLFKPKPLLDDPSAAWICQQFEWIVQQFDGDFFEQTTILVLPDNNHFPGKADNHQAMAQILFDRVKHYAGLNHWPTLLLNLAQHAPQQDDQQAILPLTLQQGQQLAPVAGPPLRVYFNPAQVNEPQAMISSFAQSLAHALAQQTEQPPAIETQQWPLLVELVAIYLGFGVPMTNSAFAFAGGCGSCGKLAAQRQAFLSQDEALFALALFCQHKQIDNSTVVPQLNSHLKKLYKRAQWQLQQIPLQRPQLAG
ncbi:MAG: hypothetical protein V7707_05230 [Motiliproteus sp.]